MTQATSQSQYSLTILGNLFEHYDKALYGLLAPFIAPLFFPKTSYIVSLILAYLPYGILLQPLTFYLLKKRNSLKHILLFSLFGMSVVTLAIGCTPTFDSIGYLAPLLLATFRALQGLFASIESAAAPLFLLDHTTEKRRDFMSSLYEMSSQGGVVLASLLITTLLLTGNIETYWRHLFLLGGGVGTLGLALRYFKLQDAPLQEPPKLKSSDILPIVRIAVVTGFICVNYLFIMELTNSYVPMVSKVTIESMMILHLGLSLLDFLLLPLVSLISQRVGRDRLMKSCSIAIALLSPLLFTLLSSPSFTTIFFVRTTLICLGLGLAVSYQNWCRDCTAGHDRFFTLALGKMVGKKIFSDPAISISLLLFHNVGSHYPFSIYLSIIALLALLTLSTRPKKAYNI